MRPWSKIIVIIYSKNGKKNTHEPRPCWLISHSLARVCDLPAFGANTTRPVLRSRLRPFLTKQIIIHMQQTFLLPPLLMFFYGCKWFLHLPFCLLMLKSHQLKIPLHSSLMVCTFCMNWQSKWTSFVKELKKWSMMLCYTISQ